MPRPVNAKAAYYPGLDGLRSLAVALVIAYHLGVPFADGGLLGVGVFFTLSGFLITSLLLNRWDTHGDLDLKHFWIRRFRRLLPAVVLLLAAVLAATAVTDPERMGTRLGESLAALFYVANWHTILSGKSYFDETGIGPLDHLWSLAVEEQFYIVWPLLLLGLIALTRARPRLMAGIVLVLGIGSFVLLAVLADPAGDATRAYEGTDTRAGGLLWGAVLAFLWRPQAVARIQGVGVRLLDLLGVAGLAGIVLLAATMSQNNPHLYTWGLAALTVSTCAVLMPLVYNGTWTARALGIAPLQWIGARSYGIYLWQMPVVAFLPERVLHGQPLARGALVVVITLVLAALSWSLVEDPIRRHGLLALVSGRAARTRRHGDGLPVPPAPRRAMSGAAAGLPAASAVPGAPASAAGTAAAAGAPDAGRRTGSSTLTERVPATPGPVGLSLRSAGMAALSALALVGLTALPQTSVQEIASQAGPQAPVGEPTAPVARPTSPATTTACTTVVHIGDSSSLASGSGPRSLIDDPTLQLQGRYRAVGVQTVVEDVAGGRSLREKFSERDLQPGQVNTNAPEAMAEHAAEIGPDGCWVVNVGLNDSANMAKADAWDSVDARIDAVMQASQGRPVLWVDAVIMPWATKAHYTPESARRFNEALVAATARHPNLWVYDWQRESSAHPEWFLENDANHNNEAGAIAKAEGMARALVAAFPADQDPAEDRVVLSR
ncbi:acyltransferase family protein [Micrococcus sp.]|uniref:acyltransferase family protein n=1 Tax=Micrococcus sp. TaxID=1271 RepID=UPI002A917FF0|nr:acyltransferase family protein [Micrococcus sp.]MDY6055748.1 acyltransferase family protein [Micrococcus sp.]